MLIFGVCFLLYFLELSGVNGFMNINVCGISNSSTFCSLKSRRRRKCHKTPPLFFELIQVDLLGVLLLLRSHVAVYSEKREDKGMIHPEQKKQNEEVMRRSLQNLYGKVAPKQKRCLTVNSSKSDIMEIFLILRNRFSTK